MILLRGEVLSAAVEDVSKVRGHPRLQLLLEVSISSTDPPDHWQALHPPGLPRRAHRIAWMRERDAPAWIPVPGTRVVIEARSVAYPMLIRAERVWEEPS